MSAKVSMILLALVAGAAIAQAAGGIKGQQRAENSAQRALGNKRPQQPQPQQQQYLPPPPPPPPQALPAPAALPQAPIKGPGQVAPVFTPARVQPAPAAAVAAFQQQQQQIQQQQQQEQEPELQQQQQQQQQEEVDPNAAAQDSAPALAAPASAAAAAANEEEANPRPEPYAFNYAFEAGDTATSGSSQREEQQDASGKVTGFYTLKGEDGRDRRVDYIADANGFRATISTNEMGTAPKDSADVNWQAQSPTDAQLRVAESATQAARLRALQNPQPQHSASSSTSASSSSQNKITSPRNNIAAAGNQREQQAYNQQQQLEPSATRGQQQVAQGPISQLQEPFEQIRQVELNARSRKSRHAPFYLFTI